MMTRRLLDEDTLLAMPRDVRLRQQHTTCDPDVQCVLCDDTIQGAWVKLPAAGPHMRNMPAHRSCAVKQGWIIYD